MNHRDIVQRFTSPYHSTDIPDSFLPERVFEAILEAFARLLRGQTRRNPCEVYKLGIAVADHGQVRVATVA
jgi:hypothetical protein